MEQLPSANPTLEKALDLLMQEAIYWEQQWLIAKMERLHLELKIKTIRRNYRRRNGR